MTLPTPLTAEQVRALLADGAQPTSDDILQILRFLVNGQTELEGRARQLKSAVGRLNR